MGEAQLSGVIFLLQGIILLGRSISKQTEKFSHEPLAYGRFLAVACTRLSLGDNKILNRNIGTAISPQKRVRIALEA